MVVEETRKCQKIGAVVSNKYSPPIWRTRRWLNVFFFLVGEQFHTQGNREALLYSFLVGDAAFGLPLCNVHTFPQKCGGRKRKLSTNCDCGQDTQMCTTRSLNRMGDFRKHGSQTLYHLKSVFSCMVMSERKEIFFGRWIIVTLLLHKLPKVTTCITIPKELLSLFSSL